MENSNIIFNLPSIQKLLQELKTLEDDRIYCRHNLTHFLDVARICYILCLENNVSVSKDVIYSAALLHDLGRAYEYKNGTPHDLVSIEIAKEALSHTSFNESDKSLVLSAIEHHRTKSDSLNFESLFYRADKLSRDCYNCKAHDCKWDDHKKNLEIKY
ncbi:HDIG domain-containing protein [Peptoniphilus asaccharolyticus DSM 20463]|uniref:HDIG domain-containing protein n=1 Tax=Peptoniphilus asaccharolyticus DSM 20463 TaxID=573058 RepID=A0A1W1ULK2_PEPAS|nr:HD domain-containing protein [Peptoniphilus asaccharolyticus]MBL7574873.1 HD domain-containing protein [Peptoniphilus asaccharolyticus]SMB81952.1 HDIG domain-containing protein [Peptoniphilus asaccharolyticus DSM 20463]